jgi:hypothetical protein
MNTQERKIRRTVLATAMAMAMALTHLAGSHASADEQQAAQQAAQLQRNIHDIRRIVDSERAQLDGALRGNAGPLVIGSRDAPGIGTMREQLVQSLERLENRCFGIDVTVNDGNAILICGNNNGAAESANVTNAANTTVVLASPSGPAPVPADAEKSEVQP